MSRQDFIAHAIAQLETVGRLRSLRTVDGHQGPVVRLDGHEVLNFSSNNYLGLADHSALIEAGHRTLDRAGGGAGASRLIVGNESAHVALESAVAAFHETQSARLFNSGYHANTGVIPALVGRGDVVFSDERNHASIIDGCRLSRAEIVVFPHRDTATLEALVSEHSGRQRLIVSDSLFSMDGDFADTAALARIAEASGALLMLDEAHAVGALGVGGRGVAATAGVEPDVLVGTLGKAFGCFGAYVAGSSALVQLLLNRARSFVFTTALPPAVAAMGCAAVEVARSPEGDSRRASLAERVAQLRDGLQRLGLLARGSGHSPIFPVVIGDEARTMAACAALLELGIYAQGIRPPTVAVGTARLRVALMASHTEQHIRALLDALSDLGQRGLIPSQ